MNAFLLAVALLAPGTKELEKPLDDVVLSGEGGRVVLSRVGATVTSYVPAGGTEVLFAAPAFAVGGVEFPHGGIPIVWPWFGWKAGSEDTRDLHGFARRLPWTVETCGTTNAVLRLVSTEATRREFPHDFRLTCSVTLGDALSVALEMTNTGGSELPFTTGFHPFFRVAHNTNVVVTGCADLAKLPAGVDRDCPRGTGEYALADCGTGRTVEISATGNDGVCVWNNHAEWPAVYGGNSGTGYCCVEPTLYGKDGAGVRLKPGETARLAMTIRVREPRPVELEATPATFAARLGEAFRLRRAGLRPVRLTLAPGDYPVERTIVLSPRTCGGTGAPLTICGKAGAPRPRLLGSRPLTGWTKTAFNGRADVWTADAAAFRFAGSRPELLFFDGVRMDEARYPNRDGANPYAGGWAYVPGKYVNMYRSITGEVYDVVKIAEADWHGWSHPEEGRVNIFPRYNWWNRWESVADVVASNRTLVLARKMPEPARPCDRYHTVGFREELDAPGEWCYDAGARLFRFIPPTGAGDPNARPVTVPVCDWVFRCERVADVRFENLEIAAAQGGFLLSDCTNVSVVGCALHDSGTFSQGGVHLLGGRRCRVADCDIWNIGGNGVRVSGGDSRRMIRADHLVENCYLHHCGQLNRHAFGVNMSGLGIVVRHNLIHDMPRCGIFHSDGRFNEISYNHVRHVNLEMEDTGAIYNCSSLTGTGCEIKYNHVSHSIGFGHVGQRYGFGHTACGIYLDDGSGGYRVYGNLVHDCRHVGMHLHCARFSLVSNNVFVANAPENRADCKQFNLTGWKVNGGYEGQRRHMDPAWRRLVGGNPAWTNYPALRVHPDEQLLPDGHLLQGNEIVNNVFYYPDQSNTHYITVNNFNPAHNLVDRNVIFGSERLRARYLTNTVTSVGGWRAWGEDVHSVFADPLFADPARGDWTLRPESPARALGFRPLPYAEMGLVRSRYRTVLPIREAEGVREHPEWIGEAVSKNKERIR